METIYFWVFGFVLGIKHALDADHLVAVSAIASRHKNPWRSALSGVFWAIGHTSTLFIAAVVLLVFGLVMPPSMERGAEFLVGLALTWLGVSVIRQSVAMRLHFHGHRHGDRFHLHVHSHAESQAHDHGHGRSVLVGMTHGLAGSAALMLLVLAKIKSAAAGLIYVLIFGLGSVVGMLVFGGLVGIPLALSADNPKLNVGMRLSAGFASLAMGLVTIAHTWPKPL